MRVFTLSRTATRRCGSSGSYRAPHRGPQRRVRAGQCNLPLRALRPCTAAVHTAAAHHGCVQRNGVQCNRPEAGGSMKVASTPERERIHLRLSRKAKRHIEHAAGVERTHPAHRFAMSAAERLVIEPLGKQHGRSAFCCGIAELDRYLKRQRGRPESSTPRRRRQTTGR